MSFSRVRRAGLPAHASAIGIVAFFVFGAACSSSTPATAKAYVNASLSTAAGGVGCNTPVYLQIGSLDSSQAPVRVEDGKSQGNGIVQVTCSVSGGGGHFNIALLAELKSGVSGASGSLRVTGAVTDQAGGTVSAHFVNTDNGNYSSDTCTLTYTYQGSPSQGVASGRIWGHVECPTAVGSLNGTMCNAHADFVFENCGT